ncbi:MAG: NAD(P)/FAD-dependent oxidoreductase [Tepidisphaeraceae bacterium]
MTARDPILVLGAGPAGSVAAIALARLGHTVTIVEKATFPRDKVCGECLSSTGIAVLERLDIAPAFRALGATELRRSHLHAADATTLSTDLPAPMLGLSRRAMDSSLLSHACDARVSVHQPATVDLPEDFDLSNVQIRDRDGRLTPASPFRYAIIADGSGSTLGKRPEPTGDFGIKAHFERVDTEADSIHLFAFGARRGYAGLAPVESGRFNVACSVPGQLLKRHRGDIDALWAEQLERLPHLARRFQRARRVTPWLSCPLPRFAVRREWPANVIPIGNAAAALEPVGGEGMGLAMRSAELAADAIHRAIRSERDLDVKSLRHSFNALWRRRRAACRATALLLMNDTLGPPALALAGEVSSLSRVGMRLIGK